MVLIGLACKNAILIVEFAKARREAGVDRRRATLEACRLRLRPIVMTSFAFILGVLPLAIATGASSGARRSLGTAVFGGMMTATLLATRAPVIVCPAMHTEMWEHPAVQENIATLRRRGVIVVDPEEGRLAGGDVGPHLERPLPHRG